jgi:hypothetical protein
MLADKGSCGDLRDYGFRISRRMRSLQPRKLPAERKILPIWKNSNAPEAMISRIARNMNLRLSELPPFKGNSFDRSSHE